MMRKSRVMVRSIFFRIMIQADFIICPLVCMWFVWGLRS